MSNFWYDTPQHSHFISFLESPPLYLLFIRTSAEEQKNSRQTDKRTDTDRQGVYSYRKQSLNIQMILEVQRYRSFHAKSGAFLRFILVLKIFHKVIVTVVYLRDTVQIHILAKHADVEIPL